MATKAVQLPESTTIDSPLSQPATPSSPDLAPTNGQSEKACEEYKDLIVQLVTKENWVRFFQGRFLFKLKGERAKPGHGTFLADLEEMGFEGSQGRSRAYRAINFYKAVRAGAADLDEVRLSQFEKDKWGPMDDEQQLEAEERKKQADARQAEIQALIDQASKAAKEAKEKTKRQGGAMDYEGLANDYSQLKENVSLILYRTAPLRNSRILAEL